LKENKFLSIIRAHEVQIDGYKFHRWGGNASFPSVITVFSAPNYCGSYKNKGAVILLDNQEMKVKQYKYVAEPYRLEGGLDAISWSLPFLAEKIQEMLEDMLTRAMPSPPMVKTQSDIEFQLLLKAYKENKGITNEN
jgi:serine/threonine-protein phosphatase 2B catalytic subunit